MEEKEKMVYGRKYRIGNFSVVKFNKVLGKDEMRELRTQMGIPLEIRRQLERSKLPCIRVEAGSGIWSVTFTCVMQMYHILDSMVCSEEDRPGLIHLFTSWFTDCTVVGDAEYQQAKAMALKAYIERQKAVELTKEEDDRILDDLRKDEEARATVLDMANEVDRLEKEKDNDKGDKEG